MSALEAALNRREVSVSQAFDIQHGRLSEETAYSRYITQKTGALWGSALFHAGADVIIMIGIFAGAKI